MKLRILATLSVLTMIPALYMIFLFAPTEATQGNAQRIFYIHVPLAIVSLCGFILGGLFAIAHLRTSASSSSNASMSAGTAACEKGPISR